VPPNIVKVGRKLDVLFDEHDRPAFFLQTRDRSFHFGDDLGRESSDGSSISRRRGKKRRQIPR
jgi:hypothetical protein